MNQVILGLWRGGVADEPNLVPISRGALPGLRLLAVSEDTISEVETHVGLGVEVDLSGHLRVVPLLVWGGVGAARDLHAGPGGRIYRAVVQQCVRRARIQQLTGSAIEAEKRATRDRGNLDCSFALFEDPVLSRCAVAIVADLESEIVNGTVCVAKTYICTGVSGAKFAARTSRHLFLSATGCICTGLATGLVGGKDPVGQNLVAHGERSQSQGTSSEKDTYVMA